MESPLEIFKHDKPFTLESGITIPDYHLGYTTIGNLNETKDNVIWVFHALTANSNPAEWWDGLVGVGKLFDPKQYFIICVNMPGSCYGSIGPLSINPDTESTYYHDFPFFTTLDMIRSYQPLRKYLGIEKIHIGIGGSMGGQQLLQWAIEEPQLFEFIFPIATNAFHSPWGIAFNASQRMAIEADTTWIERGETAGLEGLKVARSIALLSYRHYDAYGISQLETATNKLEHYKSESYQRYQGEKLANRFNAFSYYFLSKAMDAHHVGRTHHSVEDALLQITAHTHIIGIKKDLLFPLEEQQFLAKHIPNASLTAIDSFYGHDGFLLEFEILTTIITNYVKSITNKILAQKTKSPFKKLSTS
jgi:homoserine O-acetyltransferase/O-succinyltransferase